MASILDRYGIREVANVTFYELNDAGLPSAPALYLETLKVSTIEQTAEQTEARGGAGNAPLIIWDFGKEINVTLEDALFSAKSMAIMFGNGKVKEIATDNASDGKKLIMKTETFVATGTGENAVNCGWKEKYIGPDNQQYAKIEPKYFDESGKAVTAFEEGKTYFCTYDLEIDGTVIEISANTFPGTLAA